MHFVVGSMGRIGVEKEKEEEGGLKPDSDDATDADPAADGQRRSFCTHAFQT